eukprot:GHVR01163996.1.p1 GENE.GHVR01163996.1~~GHVR01163996.1.p1  ORF type:complete len:372 (+),score=15.53 GHVR01163996.1:107-1222(+)
MHKDYISLQPSTINVDNFMMEACNQLMNEATVIYALFIELEYMSKYGALSSVGIQEHEQIEKEIQKIFNLKIEQISLMIDLSKKPYADLFSTLLYLQTLQVREDLFSTLLYLQTLQVREEGNGLPTELRVVLREQISNMMKLSSIITPKLLKTELIKISISMFCQPGSPAMVLCDKLVSKGQLQRQNKDKQNEKDLPLFQKEVSTKTPHQTLMSPSPYVQEKMYHTSYRVGSMGEDTCLVYGYNLCDGQSIINFKFTHDTVHYTFCRRKHNLIDTFTDLFYGALKPEDLPPIEVMEYEGNYWVVNGNRRLLLYKKLLESKDKHLIKFPVVMDFKEIFRRKKTTKVNGEYVEIRHLGYQKFNNRINQRIKIF